MSTAALASVHTCAPKISCQSSVPSFGLDWKGLETKEETEKIDRKNLGDQLGKFRGNFGAKQDLNFYPFLQIFFLEEKDHIKSYLQAD